MSCAIGTYYDPHPHPDPKSGGGNGQATKTGEKGEKSEKGSNDGQNAKAATEKKTEKDSKSVASEAAKKTVQKGDVMEKKPPASDVPGSPETDVTPFGATPLHTPRASISPATPGPIGTAQTTGPSAPPAVLTEASSAQTQRPPPLVPQSVPASSSPQAPSAVALASTSHEQQNQSSAAPTEPVTPPPEVIGTDSVDPTVIASTFTASNRAAKSPAPASNPEMKTISNLANVGNDVATAIETVLNSREKSLPKRINNMDTKNHRVFYIDCDIILEPNAMDIDKDKKPK